MNPYIRSLLVDFLTIDDRTRPDSAFALLMYYLPPLMFLLLLFLLGGVFYGANATVNAAEADRQEWRDCADSCSPGLGKIQSHRCYCDHRWQEVEPERPPL